MSEKHNAISLSNTEVEQITIASNYTWVIWTKQMLKDIKVIFYEPTIIYYDNSSAINISKNPVLYSKTNHISIKFHFLREKVNVKEFRLEYVSTKEQIVDIFMNPLPNDTFEYLREKLGAISPPNEN